MICVYATLYLLKTLKREGRLLLYQIERRPSIHLSAGEPIGIFLVHAAMRTRHGKSPFWGQA